MTKAQAIELYLKMCDSRKVSAEHADNGMKILSAHHPDGYKIICQILLVRAGNTPSIYNDVVYDPAKPNYFLRTPYDENYDLTVEESKNLSTAFDMRNSEYGKLSIEEIERFL